MAPLTFSGSAQPSFMELDVIPNTVTFRGLVGTVNSKQTNEVSSSSHTQQTFSNQALTTWCFSSSIIFGGCGQIVRDNSTANN